MKFSLKLGERELKVEIKNLAEQANGNVLVSYGDTTILATCVMSEKDREDLGFFPLTVEYQERYYAAGKISGPRYIKREGRPSDEAICSSRLIDRAIRPRFPKNLAREIQVITTVLSWDGENDPDILGLISASLALSISDIPWRGPIGAVRVGRKEGKFILNTTYKEREGADMDIIFAAVPSGAQGTKEDKSPTFGRGIKLRPKVGDKILINMIEGNFEEVEERVILEAFDFAEKHLKEIINFQKEVKEKVGKEKIVLESPAPDISLEKKIKEFLKDRLEKALYSVSAKASADKQKGKAQRIEESNGIKEELCCFIEEEYPGEGKIKYAKDFFGQEVDRLLHENILKYNKRPDTRKLDEIREIKCEAGLLPRTHGSGLFSRGQTRALSILTLGGPSDQQLLEGMEIVGKKRFMHHYNFPPYSAGEVKPLRGPGRREIGHGMLVEKALLPLIPNFDDFPYTMRVVSEILSSNGSTSMASVSSSSLALMDAGVPLKRPAAGIAVGLVQDEKNGGYKILTDIQGPEDHYGDMDFKVAGTKKGATVLQMDVKIEGISREIIEEALLRAKKARLKILDLMDKVLSKPRTHLSPYAPRILTIQINPEKIREVIGPGGKTINAIIEETGVAIDVQDSGLIFVTSEKEEAAKKAVGWIKNITREVKVGEVFQGRVKRILDFGAFVEILPGQEGLIHISKLSRQRVRRVEDVVKIGDMVSVEVIFIDEQGRIDLSLLK